MSDMTLLLIIMAVSPFACAGIAKTKNRNPLTWFCWGIIFGVFAVGVVIFLPEE